MSDEHGRGQRPAARPPDAGAGAGLPLLLEQAFDAGSLYAVRAAAAAHASQAGLPPARVHDLVVAVHELAANAVRHGAGQGQLRIWADDGALHFQVTEGQPAGDGAGRAAADPGSPDGQAALQAAGWQIEHGHGLWLVHQVADQARLDAGPGGSTATVTFLLPDPR
jgi:anti-sigma regulatory factor (Ser/Thr protein kinase)